MSHSISKLALSGVSIGVLGIVAYVANAQNPDQTVGENQYKQRFYQTQVPQVTRLPGVAGIAGPAAAFGIARADSEKTKEFLKLQARISTAEIKLKAAESASDKTAAMNELRQVLGDDYDARLDEASEHLDQLEEQLNEMREKLAKRRDAKTEMVELRMKQLEAEANDLGWPSRVSDRDNVFPRATQTTSGRFYSTPSGFYSTPSASGEARGGFSSSSFFGGGAVGGSGVGGGAAIPPAEFPGSRSTPNKN
jgi:uncharacterized membrane protein YgcG